MYKSKKLKRIEVRLDEKEYENVRTLSEETGMSMSELYRMSVQFCFKEKFKNYNSENVRTN